MDVSSVCVFFFFFQAEDGIRDYKVTGVQTCALPISSPRHDPSMAKTHPWLFLSRFGRDGNWVLLRPADPVCYYPFHAPTPSRPCACCLFLDSQPSNQNQSRPEASCRYWCSRGCRFYLELSPAVDLLLSDGRGQRHHAGSWGYPDGYCWRLRDLYSIPSQHSQEIMSAGLGT